MITATRGLKTGDEVALPDGRRLHVASVSWDGIRFTDFFGASHPAVGAEIVPLAAMTGKAA